MVLMGQLDKAGFILMRCSGCQRAGRTVDIKARERRERFSESWSPRSADNVTVRRQMLAPDPGSAWWRNPV